MGIRGLKTHIERNALTRSITISNEVQQWEK